MTLLALAVLVHVIGTVSLYRTSKHSLVPKWYKTAKGMVNMAKHRKRKCKLCEPLFDV
jgi:hypothetical protein